MIVGGAVVSGDHVGAIQQSWDLVRSSLGGSIVIFVPCHDEERIVVERPLCIGAQVLLKPGIALSDRPVVHVIAWTGNDERNRREIRIIATGEKRGETGEIGLNGAALGE